MNARFTRHATDRINNRLGGLVTPKGDKITVKVMMDNRGAAIVTVMLRKSTSHSERYNK